MPGQPPRATATRQVVELLQENVPGESQSKVKVTKFSKRFFRAFVEKFQYAHIANSRTAKVYSDNQDENSSHPVCRATPGQRKLLQPAVSAARDLLGS